MKPYIVAKWVASDIGETPMIRRTLESSGIIYRNTRDNTGISTWSGHPNQDMDTYVVFFDDEITARAYITKATENSSSNVKYLLAKTSHVFGRQPGKLDEAKMSEKGLVP